MAGWLRRLGLVGVFGALMAGFAGCGGGGDAGQPTPLTQSTTAPSASEWMRALSKSDPALSNPTICDPLKDPGVTAGLYGLCVAYCQALSCPSGAAGVTAMTSQCKAADPKLLATYSKIKAGTDPEMPCRQAACPCWSGQEIAQVGRAYSPHINNVFANDLSQFPGGYTTLALVENAVDFGAYKVAQVYKYSDHNECGYFDYDSRRGPDGTIIRSLIITVEELQTCTASLSAQIKDLRDSGIEAPCSGNACPP